MESYFDDGRAPSLLRVRRIFMDSHEAACSAFLRETMSFLIAFDEL